MKTPSPNGPPDLARECPDALDPALRDELRRALRERHAARLGTDDASIGAALDVDAMTGPRAVVAVAVAGTVRRAHEAFVFVRGEGSTDLDGVLGLALDYLDAVLEELVGADDAFLPLDWEGRPFEGTVVFVRGEVRDYLAEEQAAKLLDEEAPPRAIPGFPR